MEIRDLQYFAVVAEHQNIARAAEALELSATALSKCLRRLEKSVGAKLVQRAAKGITLTTVGAALLVRIGTLQGTLSDVRREAADLGQGDAGHINVGVSPGASENFVADACVSLSKMCTAITLRVFTGVISVLSNRLHKGEIDFCVAGPQSFSATECIQEHLYHNPFVVFASASHRLAIRKQVSIADIAGERWASSNSIALPQWQELFRAFENSRLPLPSVALETNSTAVRFAAIAYSDYLGFTSREFLRQEARRYALVELAVNDLSIAATVSIIYRKGAYLSPAARRLIDILKAQAREKVR